MVLDYFFGGTIFFSYFLGYFFATTQRKGRKGERETKMELASSDDEGANAIESLPQIESSPDVQFDRIKKGRKKRKSNGNNAKLNDETTSNKSQSSSKFRLQSVSSASKSSSSGSKSLSLSSRKSTSSPSARLTQGSSYLSTPSANSQKNTSGIAPSLGPYIDFYIPLNMLDFPYCWLLWLLYFIYFFI
jgi:hypothetical protein